MVLRGGAKMIILIGGSTHAGKTLLAQRLLEKYKIPYLSIDHLKMGLIRSGQTSLTPDDDRELVPYLWSILKEIIKTAVENKQNLIIEGCYIPFDWQKDSSGIYLKQIEYVCLITSEKYIRTHFDDIKSHANEIEDRISDDLSEETLLTDNAQALEMCKKYGLNYILIDGKYDVDYELPDFQKSDGK